MGIANPDLGQIIAEVFLELKRERALIVHGSGVDEIAVHDGKTTHDPALVYFRRRFGSLA